MQSGLQALSAKAACRNVVLVTVGINQAEKLAPSCPSEVPFELSQPYFTLFDPLLAAKWAGLFVLDGQKEKKRVTE